jgi:hypothetical protein
MFENRLNRILKEAQEVGKFDVLHKDGRHFYADHVKKLRSPKGGRIVLMLGIGRGNLPIELNREQLTKFWTYRVKDFYKINPSKTGKNALVMRWKPHGRELGYDDYQYNMEGTQLFNNVLVMDIRNVISINGQPVLQPEQPEFRRPGKKRVQAQQNVGNPELGGV